jgi:hypothetical protein
MRKPTEDETQRLRSVVALWARGNPNHSAERRTFTLRNLKDDLEQQLNTRVNIGMVAYAFLRTFKPWLPNGKPSSYEVELTAGDIDELAEEFSLNRFDANVFDDVFANMALFKMYMRQGHPAGTERDPGAWFIVEARASGFLANTTIGSCNWKDLNDLISEDEYVKPRHHAYSDPLLLQSALAVIAYAEQQDQQYPDVLGALSAFETENGVPCGTNAPQHVDENRRVLMLMILELLGLQPIGRVGLPEPYEIDDLHIRVQRALKIHAYHAIPDEAPAMLGQFLTAARPGLGHNRDVREPAPSFVEPPRSCFSDLAERVAYTVGAVFVESRPGAEARPESTRPRLVLYGPPPKAKNAES